MAASSLVIPEAAAALGLVHKPKHPLRCTLIDLDDFKEVNATEGHAIGDQALQIIASRMTRASRSSNTVARYGVVNSLYSELIR